MMRLLAAFDRTPRLLALAALLSILSVGATRADGHILTDEAGVAILGYDPVAYFTDGAPVKGTAEHQATWEGAIWHFASAEHRDAFLQDPAKYAPQYGGWCAYGAAKGYAADTDPQTAWTVHQGKLYLNYDAAIQQTWSKDIPGYLRQSEANWPAIEAGLQDGTATVYRKGD